MPKHRSLCLSLSLSLSLERKGESAAELSIITVTFYLHGESYLIPWLPMQKRLVRARTRTRTTRDESGVERAPPPRDLCGAPSTTSAKRRNIHLGRLMVNAAEKEEGRRQRPREGSPLLSQSEMAVGSAVSTEAAR